MKRYGYFLDLLKLDIEKYPVIAVVGGGGKTSLIYRLNEELQALGKKVIISTTTHMAYDPMLPLVKSTDLEQVSEMLKEHGFAAVADIEEPAIPDFADVVVSVIGLDCLGKPICETAHRAEYTSSFLEKNLEAPVTEEDIEKIATSVHGLYKNVDHKVYRVYLNKADILPDSSPAEHIVEDLTKQGTIAAYGSLREAEKL